MKPFQPDNTTGQAGGSTILDRMLQAIADSINSLVKAVTNDNVVTATLDNTQDWPVTHGLGAPVATWDVVDINGNATVWQSTAKNDSPSRVILLRSSAAVTVNLRFT